MNLLATDPFVAEASGADPREAARLKALDQLDILDTPREEAFERITRLAKKLFGVPIAAVSFFDAHRQWCKAGAGLGASELPREHTFCKHVIATGEPLVVPDATKDGRFAQNPFVAGPANVRFYAGVPIKTDEGFNVGSLCLLDRAPREFSQSQVDLLTDLSHMVMDELKLRQLSTHDGLTGALSRRAFRAELERLVSLALRHRQELGLVVFDVDHFKSINETHGHAIGDAVLARTIQNCMHALRKSDVLGRLGGEEFAAILPNTELEGAIKAAEKLRLAVARPTLVFGDIIVKVTISLGVAAIDASARDPETLLEHADKALSDAKAEGGNRWVAARQAERPQPSRRRVLKGGQIVLHSGTSAIDCTVRALSDEGAGIDVSSTAGIPKRFTLSIKADGFERACSVIMQTPTHLEVAFDRPVAG